MNFIESCRKLIGFDSTPSQGNLAAVRWLHELAESLGFQSEIIIENQEGLEQANLILRPKNSMPTEVLFQTHLDTVEPGNYGAWTETQANPFNACIFGGDIYGLGVADVKLDFLCKLMAAKEYLRSPFKKSFVLVATYGAQTGMSGAIRLVRKKLVRADLAIVGEPTGLEVCGAGMGLATVDLFLPFSEQEQHYRESHDVMESSSTQSKVFIGKPGHSSDPNAGENAILKALSYLEQLPSGVVLMDLDGGINYNSVPSQAFLEVDFVGELMAPVASKLIRVARALRELENKMKQDVDSRFSPSHATLNLGLVRTSSAGIKISGSCRIPPKVTDQSYLAWMKDLEKVCDEVGASFSVRDYRRGFDSMGLGIVSEALELNKSLGSSDQPRALSVTTEASVFARLGMSCFVFGAGQGVGNSHQPNERVKISELEKSIEFYKKCIERFCL